VDDDATIRMDGRMLLTRMGIRPVLAVDGVDALARLEEYGEDVAVVVTDIQMPNMDGVALMQAARRMRPGLPIVATSGRLDLEAIQVLKSMDVTIFLDKPYREPQLASALQQLMAARA